MSNPKFEVYKDVAGEFRFRFKAGNGEKILASEGYTSKQSCKTGISSVKANAPFDSRYERRQNGDSHTFVLKAGNGEIIGRSQSYPYTTSRDLGIESIKRLAPDAPTEDLT